MFSNKDLRRLIIPLILEQFLVVMVGMADTMMVSSVGAVAVSGVALVDSVNNLLLCMFGALATGGAVVSSQYMGQKSKEKACEATEQLLLCITTLAVCLMVFSITCNSFLLKKIYGTLDKDVFKAARTYFYLTALSYPFLGIYNSSAATFRSMGNSRITLVASTVMNITNISGNAIMIIVFHLGVAGVGLSTLVSRIVASLILVILLRNPDLDIHIRKWIPLKFKFQIIKRILTIGIPSGLENSIFQLGKILVARQIASYGTASITANAIANTVAGFEVLPGQAIGLALITVVGQCIGARELDQAKSYTKKLLKLTYVIMFILNIGILIAIPFIVSLYQQTTEISGIAQKLIAWHSIIGIMIWPCAFTLPNALRAASDVKYTMTVSMISMWAFRILCAKLLGDFFGLGVMGVWIAMSIDWLFRTICFLQRFFRNKWQTHSLIV